MFLNVLDRKMNLRRRGAARLKNGLYLFDGRNKIGKPAGNGRGQFLERLSHRRYETSGRVDKLSRIRARAGILCQKVVIATGSRDFGSCAVRVLPRCGQNIQRRQKLLGHRPPGYDTDATAQPAQPSNNRIPIVSRCRRVCDGGKRPSLIPTMPARADK